MGANACQQSIAPGKQSSGTGSLWRSAPLELQSVTAEAAEGQMGVASTGRRFKGRMDRIC